MPVAVVMAAVLTSGSSGCLLKVSTSPLQSQNVQSSEKSPASHGARGETPTMSFVPGANREGKERVKGKAMYVCTVITYYSRAWINRVRLPILLVVS